jgi:hypothetical protein
LFIVKLGFNRFKPQEALVSFKTVVVSCGFVAIAQAALNCATLVF